MWNSASRHRQNMRTEVLRRAVVSKMHELTGGWRNLYKENFKIFTLSWLKEFGWDWRDKSECMRGTDQLKELVIDGNIILKWTCMWMWAWLTEVCQHSNEPSGCIKGWQILHRWTNSYYCVGINQPRMWLAEWLGSNFGKGWYFYPCHHDRPALGSTQWVRGVKRQERKDN